MKQLLKNFTIHWKKNFHKIIVSRVYSIHKSIDDDNKGFNNLYYYTIHSRFSVTGGPVWQKKIDLNSPRTYPYN